MRKKCGVFFTWFSCLAVVLTCFSYAAAQSSDETFYYSNGEKIPIVLDQNQIAVFFKGDVSPDSVRALLPRFRQFSAMDDEKKQDFARANIYLVPLTESISAFNLDDMNADLKSSDLVKTIGKVYTLEKKPETSLILTDEFVVRFNAGVTADQIDALNAQKNVEIVSTSEYVENQFVLRPISGSNMDALTLANQYYENDLTKFAYPNFITTFERRFVPNDPYFPNQWHLNNIGLDGGTVDADIDAPEAWDIHTGSSNIRIAILDDSIEKNHEDLQSHIVVAKDFTDDDNDPSPGPGDYHGTSVAGIAAAVGNNNKGVAGVCYDGRIAAGRLGNTLQDFEDIFYWAAITAQADVISNSWGLVQPAPDGVVDAVNYAATFGRGGKGCVVLFAAGNGNDNISNPSPNELAALDRVIAVGASTNKDVRACYSSWGDDLDVMAPSNTWISGVCPNPKPADAVGTWSTDQSGTGGFNDGTPPRPDAAGLYTQDFGGTSSACPTAAGIAGLLLSVNPQLTRIEVQDILQATAEKIAPGDANYDANGFSDHYGYGRVNAHRAIVPTVIISVAPAKVKPGDPFKVKVTGSAPFGLNAVWWFGDNTGIPDIDQAHWQNVTGAKKVYTHEWDATISKKGTFRLGANARDVIYGGGSDGFPHQASEGSGLDYAEIKVVPTFTEWAMIISGLLFLCAFIYRQKRTGISSVN